MKRALQATGIGTALVTAVGLLAAVTNDLPLAMLLWPGFLLMNYVYSHLGFAGIAFTDFGWVFWPALLVNIVLYGLLYFNDSQGLKVESKEGSGQPGTLGYQPVKCLWFSSLHRLPPWFYAPSIDCLGPAHSL
jgi:hypothetical protein